MSVNMFYLQSFIFLSLDILNNIQQENYHFLLAGAEQVSHRRKTKFFNTKIYFLLRYTICWEVLEVLLSERSSCRLASQKQAREQPPQG